MNDTEERICPKCSRPLAAGSETCRFCEVMALQAPPRTNFKKLKYPLLGGFVLLALLAIIQFYISNSGPAANGVAVAPPAPQPKISTRQDPWEWAQQFLNSATSEREAQESRNSVNTKASTKKEKEAVAKPDTNFAWAEKVLKKDSVTQQKAPPESILSAKEIYAQASPAVVKILIMNDYRRVIGNGTGFCISHKGKTYIATNAHVLKPAVSLEIVTTDDAKYRTYYVHAEDKQFDLALLSPLYSPEHHLELKTGDIPAVGSKVFTIGSPKGLTNSLSEGIISGIRKANGRVEWIQTTAPISPGSSGGPLLNENGLVIGIMTRSFERGQNLNLARPVKFLIDLLPRRSPRFLWQGKGINEQYRFERELLLLEGMKGACPIGHLRQMFTALSAENWTSLRALLAKCEKPDLSNGVYWYLQAICQNGLGHRNEAKRLFRKAISLAHKSKNSRCEMLANYEMGQIAFWRNDLQSAHNFLQKSLALNPNFAPALKSCSAIWRVWSKHDRDSDTRKYSDLCVIYAQKLARIAPQSGQAHLSLGQAYRVSKRYSLALSELEAAIKLAPDDGIAYYELGLVLGALKQWQRAHKAFRNALKCGEKWDGEMLKEIKNRVRSCERMMRNRAKQLPKREVTRRELEGKQEEERQRINREYRQRRERREAARRESARIRAEALRQKQEKEAEALRQKQELAKRKKEKRRIRKLSSVRAKWRKLRKGMSMVQVKNLIGSPANVSSQTYSTSWTYRGYSLKRYGLDRGRVSFDKKGRVDGWTEPRWE